MGVNRVRYKHILHAAFDITLYVLRKLQTTSFVIVKAHFWIRSVESKRKHSL